MARPLPVNLLLAAVGGVLLTSGLSGESLGEVLQGNFGTLDGKKSTANTADTESGGGEGEGGIVPSPATFAPSPGTLGLTKHKPTTAEQSRAIASILLSEGITNPTRAQIARARIRYQRETGVKQFEDVGANAPEFLHGLPLT